MSKLKEFIRNWLGVKDPPDWADSITELREHVHASLEDFGTTLRKFCELPCSNCKKVVVTYPLGGGYYRESSGAVLCSAQCLDQWQGKKPSQE